MSKEEKKDLFALLREVNVALGRGPRQGLNVRPGQNKILKILNKQGSMSQQELLAKVGISASSLSELLLKLEKEGYIARHPLGHKKKYSVEITEKGLVSAIEHDLSIINRDEELFGELKPEDKAELERILMALLKIWGKDPNESEGQRRERRWKENERLQDEQREIKKLLDDVEIGELTTKQSRKSKP